MDRVAVFVDAGYLYAQGSALLFGSRRPRPELDLDIDKALDCLEGLARSASGLPLLRIYWYDGTSSGPTPEHRELAHRRRVKVRLGFVNTAGQQKGVDSLLVTDMIDLARNRAMCDAVILSGDEDMRVGVQQAQQFGVRVHLLGIEPCRGSQSLFLMQEADETYEWDASVVQTFLGPRAPVPAFETTALVQASDWIDAVVGSAVSEIGTEELARLVRGFDMSPAIPNDYDRQLLFAAKAHCSGGDLPDSDKFRLRAHFRDACRKAVRGDGSPPQG